MLPDGKYFMVMWNIARTFGGMTATCLRRARYFREFGGVTSPVLSFSPNSEFDALSSSLVERGYLTSNDPVLNIFEHYRLATLAADPALDPIAWDGVRGRHAGREEHHYPTGELAWIVERDHTGTIVHRECFRPDGSRYLIDHTGTIDGAKARRVSLLDGAEGTARVFASATEFYHHWLDELIGDDRATLILDDKVAGRILRTYDRPGVLKVSPVHSNHVKSAGDPFVGEIDPNRELILRESWRWDALTFLTRSQHDDYVARFGAIDNAFVVANPVEVDTAAEPDAPPAGHRAIFLGKLTANKRVGDSIRALKLARREVPDLVLDVYGEGPESESLEALARKEGLADVVTFRGHQPGAAQEFSSSHFSLLTSRYEGMPGVILESLAHGCPAISYDIRYGPRDLIGDAGLLVPSGDVSALAAAMVRMCTEPGLRTRLSQAGPRRVDDYQPRQTTQVWSRLIAELWRVRALDRAELRLEVGVEPLAVAGDTARLTARIQWVQSGPTAPVEAHALIVDGDGGGVRIVPAEVTGVEADGDRRTASLLVSSSHLRTVPQGLATAALVGAVGRRAFRSTITVPGELDSPASERIPALGEAIRRVNQLAKPIRRSWVLVTDLDSGLLSRLAAGLPGQLEIAVTDARPDDLDVPPHVTVSKAPDLQSRMQHFAGLPRPDLILDLGIAEPHKASSLRHLLYALPDGGRYLTVCGGDVVTAGEGGETAAELMALIIGGGARAGRAGRPIRPVDHELASCVSAIDYRDGVAALTKRHRHHLKLRDWAADEILHRRGHTSQVDTIEELPAFEFASDSVLTSHGDGPFPSGPTSCQVPIRRVRSYRGAVASARQILRLGDYVLPDSWRHPHQPKLNNRQLIYSSAWFGRYKEETTPTTRREIEGSFYYFDTELPGHFGHIMTEVLGRVWGWRAAQQADPEVRPLISVSQASKRTPEFQYSIFDALGIDLRKAVVVQPREEVTVETLYAATPQFENPHYIDPAITSIWGELDEGLPAAPAPAVGDRIFISRRPGGKRDCTNTAEVENLFTSAGCQVVYPEDYDYPTQRSIFKNARVVAGFGGSGMLGAIFAPRARMVVVSGHSYNAANERLIAAAHGIPIDYLWGRSERDMPEHRFSLDAFTSDFTVDVKKFRRTVRRLVR